LIFSQQFNRSATRFQSFNRPKPHPVFTIHLLPIIFSLSALQFSALANREIEGMDNLIRSFAAIVEDFKRKPYGLFIFAHHFNVWLNPR
jgi:hypothetical protein